MAHDQNKIDNDPIETQEWRDALAAVIKQDGTGRARFLLETLASEAGASLSLPASGAAGGMGGFNTPYVNTIPVSEEQRIPGDPVIEKRIQALIRWNAVAMVLRAGKAAADVGGHIATYASSAILYEVGFNHVFHAPSPTHGGDLIYYQGHASPGIYARSYLEGRISEAELNLFRQEVRGQKGLSSYPHPWLMPDYWQFPTVSMGLGPMQAIYQARFLKYLENRGLANTADRKVWCFCGDGEMDEPESLGAITVAGREHLDNLIFVINCNLQRLDGPVRGNGKIIQELESVFKGAGWNVIKVIWGHGWDNLLAKDSNGLLKKRMLEAVDGEYQAYKAYGGAYTREHFFGKYPELAEMVAKMSDEDIWRLNRGGHDAQKVFAAYASATQHKGQPTVILAKTVKGYGMGAAGEALNITHQQKKMDTASLKAFRDRFNIPIAEEDIEHVPFYRPAKDSPEITYIRKQRESLGGFLPARRRESSVALKIPALSAFDALLKSTGDRAISTTMAFVRALNVIIKDKNIGKHIVPIVPDEARTFGMEGLFRQIGIYSAVGQLYRPVDADQVMSYREDKHGQLLEEGINEAGAFCSWLAAATSYSTNDVPMIPFYIFYSMFGFQRIGDLAWAAGDMRARGFLIGATAGRTTLAGEGLQHTDGHSVLMAATIPNCITYDPTYSYEMAVIIQDGLRRMYGQNESVFYYLTAMNENYIHPEMPQGAEEGILKGLYQLKARDAQAKLSVHLLGSGTILREVLDAAELLLNDFGISANIWSATSFTELRRDGIECERWNQLHPGKTPKQSYVAKCLVEKMPVIAATDYIRAYPDGIREFVPHRYITLGTDGFGRSDSRAPLRAFFEVNRFYIALAALKALADEGHIPVKTVQEAIKKYGIDPDKPNPVTQ